MTGRFALTDFALVPQGPYLFDCYEYPHPISSPLGDFTLELVVELNARPTPEMLQIADTLVTRFEKDREQVAQMIFEEYQALCADQFGPEWLEECNIPADLPLTGIGAHLSARNLSVHEDRSAAVYVSPNWDQEHGLTYELTEQGWTRVG